MTEQKKRPWTPGPWTCSDFGLPCAPGEYIYGADDRRMATVGSGILPADKLEAEIECARVKADAYLIAAAPDMYRALREILSDYGYCMPDDSVRMIKAALRKARGETEGGADV